MPTLGMVEEFIAAEGRGHEARRNAKWAAVGTAAALAACQLEVTQAVRALLGSCPPRGPLNPHTIATHHRDEYSIETLTFEGVPGSVITANLYTPIGRPEPFPAVAIFSGDAPEGKKQAERQRMGQLLARRGIAALLFDSPGQGERLEYYDSTLRRSWLGRTPGVERSHLGHPMFLTGNRLAHWMAFEGSRALDFLASRPEIDARRLGIVGDGSSDALIRIVCCLEARLAAAALVADTHHDPVLGGDCIESTLPGVLAQGILPQDFLIPFAPRPLLMVRCAGQKDKLPHEKTVTDLSRAYKILGKANQFEAAEERGVCGFAKFTRTRIVDHFARAFGMGVERLRDLEAAGEPLELLRCTETGQVLNSLNAPSLLSIHAKLAHELPPPIAAPADSAAAVALRADLRARFAPLLCLPEAVQPVACEVESRSNDWGLQVEKGRIVVAEGLYAPYSFYTRPANTDSGTRVASPVLLALHERGIAGVTGASAWMKSIPQAGYHVMAIDVPGVGETRLQADREENDGYEATLNGTESIWARRALNAGLNLFGLDVFSVLRTIQYLKTRWDVDKSRIVVSGTGRGALWGLYASALDKDVSRVALLRGLSSYKCLAERCRHNHHFSVYLPGCLKVFDLQHVAACIAPRPLKLINFVDQRKERRSIDAMRADYAFTASMYAALGAGDQFDVATSDSAPETLGMILKTIGAA